jgi:SAM-dependent methyltransferase
MTERLPWTEGGILGVSGAYWQTCALHAAVKLGVFTAVGAAPHAGEALARTLGANPRGLTMLLDALCAMGLLEKTGAGYANTEAARVWLSKDSPTYLGYMIMHHHHLVTAWSQLDRAVMTGGPVERGPIPEEEERESFLMGMFNLAMDIAPRLVPQIDLAGRRRLLDLGGGPGTYAIHFCMHNPDLCAAVYDRKTSEPFASQTIQRFGMEGRVRFVPGNYLKDPIEGPYDVAWLSHILHGEGMADCRRILGKAVSALAPGGLLLIHDFILEDTRDNPLFAALFSLNMLLNTEQGQAYSEGEITAMMEGAGLRSIRRLPFRGPNDSGVMAGERST